MHGSDQTEPGNGFFGKRIHHREEKNKRQITYILTLESLSPSHVQVDEDASYYRHNDRKINPNYFPCIGIFNAQPSNMTCRCVKRSDFVENLRILF